MDLLLTDIYPDPDLLNLAENQGRFSFFEKPVPTIGMFIVPLNNSYFFDLRFFVKILELKHICHCVSISFVAIVVDYKNY